MQFVESNSPMTLRCREKAQKETQDREGLCDHTLTVLFVSLSQMLPYLRVQEEAGIIRGYQIGFVSSKTAEHIIVPRED